MRKQFTTLLLTGMFSVLNLLVTEKVMAVSYTFMGLGTADLYCTTSNNCFDHAPVLPDRRIHEKFPVSVEGKLLISDESYWSRSSTYDYSKNILDQFLFLQVTYREIGGNRSWDVTFETAIATAYTTHLHPLTVNLSNNRNTINNMKGYIYFNDRPYSGDCRDWLDLENLRYVDFNGADERRIWDIQGEKGYWQLDPTSVPVPEPASILLFAIGFTGIAGYRRKLTKK